ncbi:hypothetical protein OZK63_05285 [Streptomyces sp. UMAF16]|nr:hypothetical protein [Streptomyces sp. UMAF16]
MHFTVADDGLQQLGDGACHLLAVRVVLGSPVTGPLDVSRQGGTGERAEHGYDGDHIGRDSFGIRRLVVVDMTVLPFQRFTPSSV